MTDERQVNIPLLRKAVEWAEAEAAKPNGLWMQTMFREQTDCGTAYCVAGFVCQVSGAVWDEPSDDGTVNGGILAGDFAADLLGISDIGAGGLEPSHLFYWGNSIADVRRIAEDLAGERL